MAHAPGEAVEPRVAERRERVFLLLAGIFLGTLAMLNILGITRFLDMSFTVFGVQVPFLVAVGVLPYPITFLCTDLISELYGRRRANFVVWVGLVLNVWVVFVLWLGGVLPPHPPIDPATGLPPHDWPGRVFFEVQRLTFGAVTASMLAYVTAQFTDVALFHFWKRVTKGRHLWLRNNASTLVSQLVDSVAVISITHYYARALPVDADAPILPQLTVFIASGYVFKLVVALLDTIPFYVAVRYLSRYLHIDPSAPEGS
jgi:uncharacterized integral membrane protein (TIGR00697 family)